MSLTMDQCEVQDITRASFVKHVCQIYRLARKRFRSPEDYRELQTYLADDFATHVIHPYQYASGLVLDVGCAYGGYMEAFRRHGAASVIGLELSYELLVQGNVRTGVVGDMTLAPFADESCDFVYSRGVIEHVPDQLAFCRNCYRVLRVGGYVCITTSPWYSPHAGHPRLKPFHVLPFGLAKRLSEKTRGIKINAANLSEMGLYPITIAKLKGLMMESGFELVRLGDVLLGVDWIANTLLGELLVQHVFVIGQRDGEM